MEQAILDSLIAAGLMDANGNWLVDPATGLPTTGTATKSQRDQQKDLVSEYAAAQAASGLSQEDWVKSADFKQWEIRRDNFTSGITDRGLLIENLDNARTMKDNEVLSQAGSNWESTTAARLATLNRPGGPTTQTRDQLLIDQQAIFDQSQKAYTNLLDFNKRQSDAIDELTKQIKLERDFSIPRLPEQSGRVSAGGSAQRTGQPRVGIPDLLIRY